MSRGPRQAPLSKKRRDDAWAIARVVPDPSDSSIIPMSVVANVSDLSAAVSDLLATTGTDHEQGSYDAAINTFERYLAGLGEPGRSRSGSPLLLRRRPRLLLPPPRQKLRPRLRRLQQH